MGKVNNRVNIKNLPGDIIDFSTLNDGIITLKTSDTGEKIQIEVNYDFPSTLTKEQKNAMLKELLNEKLEELKRIAKKNILKATKIVITIVAFGTVTIGSMLMIGNACSREPVSINYYMQEWDYDEDKNCYYKVINYDSGTLNLKIGDTYENGQGTVYEIVQREDGSYDVYISANINENNRSK